MTNLENVAQPADSVRIDPITALQDGIDGLSLAMFEALRGLRDAVAPESGNLGQATMNQQGAAGASAGDSNNANANQEPDSDELWHLFRSNDAQVVQMVTDFLDKHQGGAATTAGGKPGTTGGASSAASSSSPLMPRTREEFIRLHAKMEMNKDTELVMKLAGTVLEKSRLIDEKVSHDIPGMHRTRSKQLQRIEELVQQNQDASNELEKAYAVSLEKRNQCRDFIRTKTCQALGMAEED